MYILKWGISSSILMKITKYQKGPKKLQFFLKGLNFAFVRIFRVKSRIPYSVLEYLLNSKVCWGLCVRMFNKRCSYCSWSLRHKTFPEPQHPKQVPQQLRLHSQRHRPSPESALVCPLSSTEGSRSQLSLLSRALLERLRWEQWWQVCMVKLQRQTPHAEAWKSAWWAVTLAGVPHPLRSTRPPRLTCPFHFRWSGYYCNIVRYLYYALLPTFDPGGCRKSS